MGGVGGSDRHTFCFPPEVFTSAASNFIPLFPSGSRSAIAPLNVLRFANGSVCVTCKGVA